MFAVIRMRKRQHLHGKGATTTTGTAGIGITERKTTVVQTILPVYFHTIQIQLVGRLYDAAYTLPLEHDIAFLLLVEAQHITHTAAPAPFYTYTQEQSGIKTFGLHEAFDFFYCTCCKGNGARFNCLHHGSCLFSKNTPFRPAGPFTCFRIQEKNICFPPAPCTCRPPGNTYFCALWI